MMRRALVLCLLAAAVAGCSGGMRSAEGVVRAWSKALDAGDNERAASLFAEGAEVIQGGRVVRLATHADAVAWNEELPCSGRIVAVSALADRRLRATFLLGDRQTTPCDGPGARVEVEFMVRDGKIVVWKQLGGGPPPGTIEIGTK